MLERSKAACAVTLQYQVVYCRDPLYAICALLRRPRATTVLQRGRRAPSPAWHRRARKQRAAARKLLRVEAARALLKAHHGSAPPAMGKNAGGKGTTPGGNAGGKAPYEKSVERYPKQVRGVWWVCDCTRWSWATRSSCTSCKLPPPQWIQDLQKKHLVGTAHS